MFPASGESPLSSLPGAWVQGLGPSGQQPWLPEAGGGWQPLGKQTAPWLEMDTTPPPPCKAALWLPGHAGTHCDTWVMGASSVSPSRSRSSAKLLVLRNWGVLTSSSVGLFLTVAKRGT